MSDLITMDKIIRLMDYLGVKTYVIPHYQLPMPEEANGSLFRPEKVFKLCRDGTMSYKGYGYGLTVRDVYIENLKPNDRFLTRAYLHLVGDARKKVKSRAQSGGIVNLEYLILKFNGIDFIDGENAVG